MTGQMPSVLLLQGELKTKLPSLQTEQAPSNAHVHTTGAEAKQKAKEYADQRRNAIPRNLNVGEWVLVKQNIPMGSSETKHSKQTHRSKIKDHTDTWQPGHCRDPRRTATPTLIAYSTLPWQHHSTRGGDFLYFKDFQAQASPKTLSIASL